MEKDRLVESREEAERGEAGRGDVGSNWFESGGLLELRDPGLPQPPPLPLLQPQLGARLTPVRVSKRHPTHAAADDDGDETVIPERTLSPMPLGDRNRA